MTGRTSPGLGGVDIELAPMLCKKEVKLFGQSVGYNGLKSEVEKVSVPRLPVL